MIKDVQYKICLFSLLLKIINVKNVFFQTVKTFTSLYFRFLQKTLSLPLN